MPSVDRPMKRSTRLRFHSVVSAGHPCQFRAVPKSGEKGTEIYFIADDPDAVRTVKSIQVKLVFAFQSK